MDVDNNKSKCQTVRGPKGENKAGRGKDMSEVGNDIVDIVGGRKSHKLHARGCCGRAFLAEARRTGRVCSGSCEDSMPTEWRIWGKEQVAVYRALEGHSEELAFILNEMHPDPRPKQTLPEANSYVGTWGKEKA